MSLITKGTGRNDVKAENHDADIINLAVINPSGNGLYATLTADTLGQVLDDLDELRTQQNRPPVTYVLRTDT